MTAAIVLAGAHVWNEDDLSAIAPRLLLPLANTPLVDHILVWLSAAEIRRIIFCDNDVGANLWERLGTGAQSGFEFYYCIDHEPRGPAGCCYDASRMVRAARYVVVEGSVLPRCELAAALAHHEDSHACATIVVTRDTRSQSSADYWSPVGVYIFEAEALADVPATGFQDIKEMLLPRLHGTGAAVLTHSAQVTSPRISGIHAYFAVHAYLLNTVCGGAEVPAGYVLSNGTCRHSRSCVASDVTILGPVMIGPDSRVETGAALIGPTAIGRNCVIGAGCVVQRSILWDGSVLGSGARVNRCLLATGTRVAAGASETDNICYGHSPAPHTL